MRKLLEFSKIVQILSSKNRGGGQNDPPSCLLGLKDYQDCFSEYPGKLPNPVSLEIDESVTPVIHPPRKIPFALLKPAKEKLLEMEHDGIIVKEEGHIP